MLEPDLIVDYAPRSQFEDFHVRKENIQLDFATSEPGKVLLAAVFGCLGGVVSLLMRLSEFETTKGRSRQFLVLSGTTLPIVGGIFAAVIASLLASKIINFGTSGAEGLNTWLFIVIGFLAGFSERFTRNLLSIAENQFSRSSDKSDRKRPKAGARLPNSVPPKDISRAMGRRRRE